MLATIDAVLAGAMTRAEAMAWTVALLNTQPDRRNPFGKDPEAWTVFESLFGIDEIMSDGEPRVREVDLRSYRRWLLEEEFFIATRDPMVALRLTIDELAMKVGGEPVRFWLDGLGWHAELRFRAANGRPFVALCCLEQPSFVEVRFLRDDVARDALADLLELVALADDDIGLHPSLEATGRPGS